MLEYYGPLQHVTIAATLWLIPLFPLLAAVLCGVVHFRALRAADAKREASRVIRVAGGASVAAMGLAFAMSVYHFALLARATDDARYLLQHLWRMIRVGQLDASFDLALDPLSSVMALVITGIGALIFTYATAYMETTQGYARFFAWMNLFVFAMLVLVLADNLVLMFFGWEGVGLCSWGLIGFAWNDERKVSAGLKAFVVNRIGDAGFLLGIAALFWGLGGTWADSDYVPDLNPRFSAVALSAKAPEEDELHTRPTASGHGLLTMTSYSGAVVFMDDSRVPLLRASGEPLRAPFARFPIAGGVHSFRIHAGAGLDDYLVTHVAFGEGREVALTAFGPTVTFRHVRDQIVTKDMKGQSFVKESLLGKAAFGSVGVVALACLLLFIGAVGKSAQIPLFIWLPDAMAGPTPVSALIHAATMVTAGVYMIARLGFLFALSPVASMVVACTGALTALAAATMGVYQYDLKKILAYSTISQLGFMMIGVGVGSYTSGIFHLVTHACFKACLFLAAGSVISGVHAIEHGEAASQDIRNMGGLKARMPKTARAYAMACLAITGAPLPGLAGFWSKDDILAAAYGASWLRPVSGPALAIAGIVAASVTSFYMWRSYYVVFDGPLLVRADARAVRESPTAMTRVLGALATLSAIAGIVLGVSAKLVGAEGGGSLLEQWLEPVTAIARVPAGYSGPSVTWGVIAASYGAGLAGWAVAKSRYGASRAKGWDTRERHAFGFAITSNGYYVDRIATAVFAGGALALRGVLASFDRYVVDGFVNGAALFTRALAWITGRADDAIVDGGVRLVAEATLHSGEKLRSLQTGRVQTYAYAIAVGVLGVAFLQYWLR